MQLAGPPRQSASPDEKNDRPSRPILVLLTEHWLSLFGLGLILTAVITMLFVLPLEMRGHVENPYSGILIFVIIPLIFFAGVILVPIGVALGRRRIRARLEHEVFDRRQAWRRLAIFVVATGALNVIIGTQLTYRAVEHMETVQFCGQTCHVMTPEFVGHEDGAHAQLECVSCHVAPGAAGWIQSKMNGTRQLIEVI